MTAFKKIGTLVGVMGLIALNSAAASLTVGDAHYVGYVDPGSPANALADIGYINDLIDVAPGTTVTVSSRDFVRAIGSPTGLPDAVLAGADDDNKPADPIDVTGFEYFLAKYGSVSHIWYVAGLSGSFTVPNEAFGGEFHTEGKKAGQPKLNGLSNWSLYNGTTRPPQQVPDGGATAALLGLGILGLAALSRKR